MYKLGKVFRFVLPDRRSLAYIRKIRKSGLFDPVFYRNNYPGLRPIFRRFPIRHYVAIGEREALRPNPDFSPVFYLHYNPDVGSAGIPPFLHWIEIGHREGRITKELPDVVVAAAKDMPRLPSGGHRAARPFAVVAHLFYYDLWDEIDDLLTAAAPDAYFFVTLTDRGEETAPLIARIQARFPEARCFRFPNRGRDILPFVHLLNAGLLDGYAAVGKIDTKRSPHRADGDHWRRHLMRGILPPDGLETLLARFLAEPRAAIWVADGQHYRSEEWWGSNRGTVARLLRRLEIRLDPDDDLAFPAGSMYWLKPVMIAMIKGIMLDPDEFEPETSQVDGTVAHAFERMLGFIARAGGMRTFETGELGARPPLPAPPAPAYVSAFYLPQFHPIPENDAWWGKGFTEWTNVTRAQPNFAGHAQPAAARRARLLRPAPPETMRRAGRLAAGAGIDAFCVLPLLVRRPPAAGEAARRPARPPRRSRSASTSPGRTRPGGATGMGSPARSSSTRATAKAGRRGWSKAPCPISPTPATPAPTAAGRAFSSTARPTCPIPRAASRGCAPPGPPPATRRSSSARCSSTSRARARWRPTSSTSGSRCRRTGWSGQRTTWSAARTRRRLRSAPPRISTGSSTTTTR